VPPCPYPLRGLLDPEGKPMAAAGTVFGIGRLLQISLRAILKVSIEVNRMSIRKVSIRQIKAARALLGWSQADLARESGISEPTIKRLESKGDDEIGGRESSRFGIVAALEAAGTEFISNERGEGVVKLRNVHTS
jgi:DNA-binding XRE family transcriptional regulator